MVMEKMGRHDNHIKTLSPAELEAGIGVVEMDILRLDIYIKTMVEYKAQFINR